MKLTESPACAPPDWLTPEELQLWHRIVATIPNLLPCDAWPLGRYVTTLRHWLEIDGILAETGPTYETHDGAGEVKSYPRPELHVSRTLDAQLRELEKAFLMSPESRKLPEARQA